MQDAEACFMIAARNYTDKTAAVSISRQTIGYLYSTKFYNLLS